MNLQKNNTAKKTKYAAHQLAYFANFLTIDGSVKDNLTKSLSTAKVDLNPHQVEAALFALKSPLSQGVLLADEVGLGKTIEAGLVIAQKWAERNRKIILIVPAMLRNQWSQELLEKFNIPSCILESSSYNKAKKINPLQNPFDLKDNPRAFICSYEFAASKSSALKEIQWDLVVFDEAHRLRNVWQRNGAKIAKTLRHALAGRKKILLTATPLQNSLLEMHGLVSIIDPYVLGSVESFKSQFVDGKTDKNLYMLRSRLSKICHRTLRRQVQDEGGIRFTRRHSLVQDFTPFAQEEELYKSISEYLQRDDIASFKPEGRHLVTLVVRKILASSSFAIAETLDKMIERLKRNEAVRVESLKDYENTGEIVEENCFETSESPITPSYISREIKELEGYRNLAKNIRKNAKGEALLAVLAKAFRKVKILGGQRKAVIFTESCRTQKYLQELLEANGYKGQLSLLNGSNNDPDSKCIYKQWVTKNEGSERISNSKTANMKAAIIDDFKNRSTILISTESGAEGVNLQFCSLLINYDLPWNPQRVEQRIGRVHRYGQKNDVIVVNFLNRRNRADQLVFELLEKKFKLFNDVFGASDEILGAIESGISIEKRINDILQKCRHTEEIEAEFEDLQDELSGLIKEKATNARKKLLEYFDEDIAARLETRGEKIELRLSEHGVKLKAFCHGALPNANHFADDSGFSYEGKSYYYNWQEADENSGYFLNVDSELVLNFIDEIKAHSLPLREIIFDYDSYNGQLSDLNSLRAQAGWLKLSKLNIKSADTGEKLVFSAVTDDGTALDQKQCERLMLIPAKQGKLVRMTKKIATLAGEVKHLEGSAVAFCLEKAKQLNLDYYNEELEKLYFWAADIKEPINQELKHLEKEIASAQSTVRVLLALEKLSIQQEMENGLATQRYIHKLEKEQAKKRAEYFKICDRVDKEFAKLIKQAEARLEFSHTVEEIFSIRWKLL